MGAAILKPFVDEENIESKVQGNRNKQAAKAEGYDLSELDVGSGATILDVQGAAIRKRKAESRKTKEEDHTRRLEPLTLQLGAQSKQSERQHTATMTQLGNQNAIAMAGLTQSNNQFMAQMADAKDQRAMELQMRREELDRVDARDSRNRRRDSIAALTSGLAALGAAFAL